MNILFLTYQGGMAGSTNSISFLAKGLADKGHTIVVACRDDSLLYSLLVNTPVVLEPMLFHGRFSVTDMKTLAALIDKHQIQVVNAQSSHDRYTSMLVKWFLRPAVKVIHTRRQRPRSSGGRLQNWLYVKGTDRVVVISDELKKVFAGSGYPESHLKVIYNGTPASQYDVVNDATVEELRARFGLRPGDRVIGCISRMKEQSQLIEALALLPPDIKVVFAGIRHGSLDTYVRKFGVKNEIIYAGVLNRTEVLNLYKLLKLSVLASTMDGFGLVLVEAMALGVPVVATNAYGIKDVVQNERNGLLFENRDIAGLARQIRRLLEDESLRGKLITNGKVTAFEKFSIEKTIDNYEAFFQSLLREP